MLTTFIKKLAGFQVFKFSLYYNLLFSKLLQESLINCYYHYNITLYNIRLCKVELRNIRRHLAKFVRNRLP